MIPTSRLVALLVLVFMHSLAGAQVIDSVIARYATQFGQERVYFHYDKSAYAPGETVWFKTYLMEGVYPADASRTLYTDWSDDKGKLLYRSVSPIVDGTTNGQFDVPAGYTGKYIHVRSYTRWMLNFDTAFLYQRDIRILAKKSAGSPSATSTTLTFFPEGGDAVAGQVNKIAFKAHDQFGRPVNIRGVVQDQKGTIVDSLRPQHDGMGFIFLSPQAGDNYTARWKDEKGLEKQTALPAVKPAGVVLQVSGAGNRKFFQVNTTTDANFQPKLLHIIGTMHQGQIFKISRDPSAGEIKGAIPTQSLVSGVMTITVFDEAWKPLAERITYVNNEEYRQTPEVEVKHWGLNKRARNEVELKLPDMQGGNFSVAVTDVQIGADSSDNIISHLLLTSELKGQVYNPAYYFRDKSDSTARKLDLVMLTHGWRRFNWADVAKGKYPTIRYPRDTAYHTLSGRIYGATPTQLREGGSVILIVKQKSSPGQIVALPVDATGAFNDPNTIIFDTVNIYYQFKKGKGSSDVSARFLEGIQPPLNPPVAARGLNVNAIQDTTGDARHAMLADELNKLLAKYEGQLLGNVTVKAKTKTPIEVLDEKYATSMFKSDNGYQFDMINDPAAQSAFNIFSYLQGRVAGLKVNNAMSSSPTLDWRGGSPQVFIDEMPADVEMLASIPVNDIAYVKVFRPPFLGGNAGGNGGIAVYTRRGGDVQSAPGKGLPSNNVIGYSGSREFYSPNYSTFNQEHEKADIRSTLYWNPQLLVKPGTDKAGFTFYNNDITKAFRVIIEGITPEGKLTHLEYIME